MQSADEHFSKQTCTKMHKICSLLSASPSVASWSITVNWFMWQGESGGWSTSGPSGRSSSPRRGCSRSLTTSWRWSSRTSGSWRGGWVVNGATGGQSDWLHTNTVVAITEVLDTVVSQQGTAATSRLQLGQIWKQSPWRASVVLTIFNQTRP